MKKKLKLGIFIFLLLMSIGFAASTATLDITNLLSIGFDAEDFKVYVSRIVLDGTNLSSNISEDGSEFTFSVDSKANALTYRVKNLSSKYDAEVHVSCTTTGSATLDIDQVGTIPAQSVETKTIHLNNHASETISCKLTLNSIERTSKADAACCTNASNIQFTPEDSNWKVTTVEEALNYLRSRW